MPRTKTEDEDEVPGFIWFARTSWAYLGCNKGSARWSARAKFLYCVIPTYIKFRNVSKEN